MPSTLYYHLCTMTFFEKIRCLFTFGQGVVLPLPEISDNSDPNDLFSLWLKEAESSGILLPESMSISTVNKAGQPSSRMVLLKDHNPQGFVFYTNFGSKKSQELTENPNISLLFHWNVLQRQVRIEGSVEKICKADAEKYFHSRDRGSQIGAWASKQSSELQSRDELKEREKFYKEKFAGKEVPLPEFWGGYLVKPRYIEFWQGRASRLHDRVTFNKQQDQWHQKRLYP